MDNSQKPLSEEEFNRIEEKIFKLLWYVTKNDFEIDFEEVDFAFSPRFEKALGALSHLQNNGWLPEETMKELNELYKSQKREYYRKGLDKKYDGYEHAS
jgi:hypothetical protein